MPEALGLPVALSHAQSLTPNGYDHLGNIDWVKEGISLVLLDERKESIINDSVQDPSSAKPRITLVHQH